MAIFINPNTGERFANVPDEDQARARSEFGLVPEDEYRTQQESGGFVDQVVTAGEEAGRRVASLAAPLKTFVGDPFATAESVAPTLFTEPALDRREANPTAAAIGGQLPFVPAYASGGLAAMLAADVVSGAAEEATDAEIQNRGISGTNVLRNGALNAIFSGAAVAMPAAARGLLTGGEDIVRRSAQAVSAKMEAVGAKAIEKRVSETVEAASKGLDSVKAPKVANNPRAQREAIRQLSDAHKWADPEMSKKLQGLLDVAPTTRYRALREMLATAEGQSADALTALLERPALWGQKVLDFEQALKASKDLVPGAGATVESWQAFADSIRALPSSKMGKLADRLDELVQTKALDAFASSVAGPTGKAITGKVAGTAGSVAAGSVASVIPGGFWPAAYAFDKLVAPSVEAAAERTVAPAIKRGLVDAGEFLKRIGEHDRRLTARLLVDQKAAANYVRTASVPASPFVRFKGEHDNVHQAFTASRDAVEQYAKHPQVLLDLLDENTGGLHLESPTLFRQVTEQALRVQNFLQRNVPKRRGVSVARPNGTPPTSLEMRQWILRFTAATDPESVMADAKAGNLRREQLDTLREVWPDEYKDLEAAVLEALSSYPSTPATRMRVSTLFNLGGSIEPALAQSVKDRILAARQKNPTAPAPSRITRAEPVSKQNLAPAGIQALELGKQLSFT